MIESFIQPQDYERLQGSFTTEDYRYVREALELGGLPAEDVVQSFDCYPCGIVMLSDPRLRYLLESRGARLGVSLELYYAAQVFAVFRHAGVNNYALATSLTWRVAQTARNLMPDMADELPQLQLEVETRPSLDRTLFSVRASLEGQVSLLLKGSFPTGHN